MRLLAAGALLFALTPAVAEARPRAAIAFLPWPGSADALVHELAKRPGMAVGLTSPTVGGFDPRQMALDMSQGTRIPTRLYRGRIPALRLVHGTRGWELGGWTDARARASKAPGDLVPGLLAQTVGGVAYAGIQGEPAPGAIVAADESGRIARASVGDAGSLAARAASEWDGASLLVADLPSADAGLAALDRLLAARRPGDVVYVIQAPAGHKATLLPSGAAGLGIGGRLRSATTRLTGLVAATDVAPTVLRRLGIAVPDAMEGEPIEPRGARDPGAVVSMSDRLAVVSSRRGTVLAWLGGTLLALLALMSVFRGPAGVRAAFRVALLAALWAPGVMLLTAALAPSRIGEALVIALGSAALAIVTDVVLRWPAGPALPALVVFAAHAIDLARGSPLIARSLAGPNPAGGARFFGIGNELEVVLAVTVLLGAGAALAWLVNRGRSERRSPIGFALAAALAAAVMGAGRLGADVGAVITLALGAATAVVVLIGVRSRRAAIGVIAAPVVALATLVVIDVATGGNGHLTRSVLHANGSGGLQDVLTRRVRSAISPLGHPVRLVVFGVALAIVVALAALHRRIFAALGEVRGGAQLRAGLVGAFFAVVAGTLANDSGPLILEIGAVLLVLAAGYALAKPPVGRSSPA